MKKILMILALSFTVVGLSACGFHCRNCATYDQQLPVDQQQHTVKHTTHQDVKK